ncbi:hypothetical protein GCM10027359_22990 [Marilutibacter aestuarii]
MFRVGCVPAIGIAFRLLPELSRVTGAVEQAASASRARRVAAVVSRLFIVGKCIRETVVGVGAGPDGEAGSINPFIAIKRLTCMSGRVQTVRHPSRPTEGQAL